MKLSRKSFKFGCTKIISLVEYSLAEPVDEMQKSYEQFLQRMKRKKKIQVVTRFFLYVSIHLFLASILLFLVLGAFVVANLNFFCHATSGNERF